MAKPHRILILGDSYSEGGAWVEAMRDALGGAEIVNLGVTGSTIRDKSNDRQKFPYHSKPAHPDSDGNRNTLGCQIEKLKRMMEGVDLTEKEKQIYQSAEDYPDIIILEGGMNDGYDSDETVATYSQQFVKQVSDVWIKDGYDEIVKKGNAYIKTPMEEVDRTCFAGAYRYLVEELSTLFPKAQFFFTTASRMGYWFQDINVLRDKTAAQQRECARLCGAAVIDWNAYGSINTITNFPPGDGTEENPYPNIWIKAPDTPDGMHPNGFGAKKYGVLAAKMIELYYLGIDEF